ncbi:FMN-binding negative transcriptional regulator [Aeromicrobium ginsengisoli]|uniref:FMN-binding negative transcriptional regulator n=1 Tax=Aeromicrobium ginsengisoli TaxID=363867 RepID=A0A5M4FJ25_9ACTN|nr:FMN-binding negative transcriptional regulator [Aeromicrobium ginsengisoli]KAA1400100.1 FMN-binding negative transcriptional regulator [Aeromicrobium ginsengisoli]
MYVPHFNAMDDPNDIRAFVESIGSAELVTVGADGTPVATLLPILWSPDGGTVVAHMARANGHWRQITEGSRCLAIIAGPQAYISPSWYAAKAEHGRVVPTWNYSAVHLTGTVRVHDDPEWVRDAVTRLTDRHEQRRAQPWAVTDAPEPYVDKNLKAIVGLELAVERVEAKAKLSQNRSDADRAGVVAGLRAEGGDPAVADAMDA